MKCEYESTTQIAFSRIFNIFNSTDCEMTAVCIALHTVKPSFHKDWNNMPHMGLQLMMTSSMIMMEVT